MEPPATISKVGVSRHPLPHPLLRGLIPKKELRFQVELFGNYFAALFAHRVITIVPVFPGAMYFTVDLLRRLTRNTSLKVRPVFTRNPLPPEGFCPEIFAAWIDPSEIESRDVFVIGDVLASGWTAHLVLEFLSAFGPKSISTCFFLRKARERTHNAEIRHCLFEIDDVWVVGYGLDHQDLFRDLTHVAELVT